MQELISKWINMKEKALAHAPAGSLNIKHKEGRPQYYQFISGSPSTRKYLSKINEMPLIKALAQKDYDTAVLKVLKKVSKNEHLQEEYIYKEIDNIYESLTPERQALVTPIRPTDSQYVKIWQETPYRANPYPYDAKLNFYTERDERVRSKSELIIANTLFKAGLPYKYECPLKIGNRIYYPDFTILDIRTRSECYLEHFGMMDRPDYSQSFIDKVYAYEINGFLLEGRLIMTFETSENALDTRYLKFILSRNFGI